MTKEEYRTQYLQRLKEIHRDPVPFEIEKITYPSEEETLRRLTPEFYQKIKCMFRK